MSRELVSGTYGKSPLLGRVVVTWLELNMLRPFLKMYCFTVESTVAVVIITVKVQ